MNMLFQKSLLAYKYYRNLLQKRAISVNLEVTKRCNAKCDFCDYWKTKKEDAISDYGPVIKKIDPMMVSITGGEPLLRLDLPDLIRGIKKAVPIIYVGMITNGALLTLEKAKKLKAAGINQIGISLDYLDERHDQSRGIPGLWKHVSELIPQLPKLGFDAIILNWIILEENFEQTLAVAEQAKAWGVRVSYTAYSDLKNMNDQHFLSPENMKKFPDMMDQVLKFKRKNKAFVRSSDFYLERIPRFYGHQQIPNCPAGLRWIQVTPEGWFKACSELPPTVFWDKYDHQKSFEKQDCTACWYSCRGEAQTPINWHRIREFL